MAHLLVFQGEADLLLGGIGIQLLIRGVINRRD